MKNLKKILSIILVTTLMGTTFIACTKGETVEKNDKTDAVKDDTTEVKKEDTVKEEQVTITVWGDQESQAWEEPYFTEINKIFEAKYPNIKLDYQYSGSDEAINVALQANSLPDLLRVQGNKTSKMMEMVKGGFLLNLDKYNLDSSRFPETSIDYATEDGSVYCSYPSFLDYALIYYNKDIFQKYNLSVPNTFDEFLTLVETLKASGEQAIAFGGKGDFDRYWFMGVMGTALFDNVIGEIANKSADIDYSNMVKAFDYYREFGEKGYLGENYVATDGAGAQLAFTNGKAAMIADGTWNNQIYIDANLNIGRFAFPGVDGKRYAQSGPSNTNTYAVAATTKHPAEAAKYIEFLNSIEAQQLFTDILASVPLVKDLVITNETTAEMADFDVVGYNIYQILSEAGNENSKPQDVFIAEILPKLMLSEITGQEAVDKLKAEIAKAN